MSGRIIIIIAFNFALISTILYFLSAYKFQKLEKFGRIAFVLTGIATTLASGILLGLILSHDFRYTCVWSYSSKGLSDYLLISSFYAGQEGSFLLWALFMAVLGMILIPYLKKRGYESAAMGFFTLIIAFLLLLLIIKSPFEYVWETINNVKEGFTPLDGRGLNPILENFWMAIHPPVLFAGYAMMAVPYVLAIAALIKRDYQGWVRMALPWTIAASAVLGTGIALGAFWSYETLGWGGFWGWDPVENSSLLPWLLSIALIHTLIVQRRSSGVVKTNLQLAMWSFILVLLATFLTRSGVLGEASVHTFIDPGKLVYLILILFILLFTIFLFVFFFYRYKSLRLDRVSHSIESKGYVLLWGVFLILAISLIIFVGTTFPLLFELLGMPKSSVDISFYNNLKIFAVLMLLLNALYLSIGWKRTVIGEVLKKTIVAAGISLVVTIVICVQTIDIKYILSGDILNFIVRFNIAAALTNLEFAAIFSLIINFEFLFRKIKSNPAKLGGSISHIGLALLMLGVIASGGYSLSQTINLRQSNPQIALDSKISLLGNRVIQYGAGEKYIYDINIVSGSDSFDVFPAIYWSGYNDKKVPFFEPGIKSKLLYDIYISPHSIYVDYNLPTITLDKGDSLRLNYDSTACIKMVGFDMSKTDSVRQNGKFMFGAIVSFYYNNQNLSEAQFDTLYILIDMSSGECQPIWKQMPEKDYDIGFIQFIPGEKQMSLSKAVFGFSKDEQILPPTTEVLSLEVSKKPLMNLVWAGMLAIVLGLFISIFQNIKK